MWIWQSNWLRHFPLLLGLFSALALFIIAFMLNGEWGYDLTYQFGDILEPLTRPVTPIDASSEPPIHFESYQSHTGFEDLFHGDLFDLDGGLLGNTENIGSASTGHSDEGAISSTSHSAVSSPAPSVTSLPPSNLRFLSPHMPQSKPSPPESVLNPDELVWNRDAKRGTLRVQCPKCGKWIGTGSNQRTTGSLVVHMRSIVKCRVRSQLDLEFGRARIARTASFPVSAGGPSSQRLFRAQSAPPAPSVHVEFDVTTPSKFRDRKYALLQE
jgi:hypothetical protein